MGRHIPCLIVIVASMIFENAVLLAAQPDSTTAQASVNTDSLWAETIVHRWVYTLNQQRFDEHLKLFKPGFRCIYDMGKSGINMNANQCIKRKRREFSSKMQIELIKTETTNFSSSKTYENFFDVTSSERGIVLSFDINFNSDTYHRIFRCELEVIKENQQYSIIQERLDLIDEERINKSLKSTCYQRMRKHCLLLETFYTDPARLKQLADRLRRESYDADFEGNSIALTLDGKELKRLFGGYYVYLLVERSSKPGQICNAYVEDIHIPKRYQQDIRSVEVGHQICE